MNKIRRFDLFVRHWQERRLRPGWTMRLWTILKIQYPLMSEERYEDYMSARVHCRMRHGVIQYAFGNTRIGEKLYWPRLEKMIHRSEILQYGAILRGEKT